MLLTIAEIREILGPDAEGRTDADLAAEQARMEAVADLMLDLAQQERMEKQGEEADE